MTPSYVAVGPICASSPGLDGNIQIWNSTAYWAIHKAKSAIVEYGRVNHATIKESQEDTKVVLGTLPVNPKPASVLFDSGASHSYLSEKFALLHDISFEELPTPFMIKTPGSTWRTSRVSHDNEIAVEDVVFLASIIALKSSHIDIILGMDWFSKHRAKIDCATKSVQLTHP